MSLKFGQNLVENWCSTKNVNKHFNIQIPRGQARTYKDIAKYRANARQSCTERYGSDSISTSKYRAGKPAPTKTLPNTALTPVNPAARYNNKIEAKLQSSQRKRANILAYGYQPRTASVGSKRS